MFRVGPGMVREPTEEPHRGHRDSPSKEDERIDIPISPVIGVKRRGFASLTPERRKEIAAMGARAVPEEKRSFARNRDLARDAGRKGGQQSHRFKKGDA